MKKKIIIACLCLFVVTGCGEKIPKLKNGEEAVVTFKNGEKISVDELYNKLKETSAMNTLVSMIDRKLLEDKYKDYIEEAKKEAEEAIATIKAQYGDEAASMIQQYTGYQSLEAYQDAVYINNMQTKAVNEYASSLIKEKEIKKYYEDEIVGDIKVSHILIAPEVKDDMSAEDKTKAENVAKKEAEEIIKTLNATKKADVASKFAELAKEKSDDEGTAKDGGNMGYINKATMETAYKEFATKAYALKDGAYTTSVVKTEYGYHVILRVESKSKAKLDTVRDSIIETLRDQLKANDATVQIEAMRKLRKEYGMDIIDTDIKSQYSTYIQNSLYSAEQQNKTAE